ncbi:MAG: DUF1294 domain-containing protein [Sulfuricurvum sp.]|nr:MAG: hypothetical protein B7Y30_03630 [Campylobacterales bacterium 16-40-21]OZA02600.1 MAG: hypothetical protein B7X89_08660 [Sulfuricurvum sp. 17-40-25]
MFLQIISYLLAINFITFIIFGLDKYFAVNQMWRIREGTLITVAICGGSIGALTGQKYFRHKRKSFKGVFPILIFLQITVVIAYLIYRFVI